MNKFFTIAFAACCIFDAKSQAQNREMIEINPHPFEYNKKLPFSHIEVIDSRFDTTKIGYIARSSSSFKKCTVAPSFSAGIQNSLNASLKPDFDSTGNRSLLIVIKNFWLKEVLIKEQSTPGCECMVRLELYLKADGTYFPIVRIDTVLKYALSLRNNISELVVLPFRQSLERLEHVNFDKVASSKNVTWADIEKFNEKRFQQPLYSAKLQKGIYLTFADFLQNRLDTRPFEIQFGKLTDELYLVDNEGKKAFTEFWAFCDGNKLYINSGFNFYELTRAGRGFEFWGNSEVIIPEYPSQFSARDVSAGSIAQGLGNYGMQKLLAPKSNHLRPFQVNMENGKTY